MAGAGCTTLCQSVGPECESSFAGGALAIVEPEASPIPLDAWADAASLYEGDEDDGTSFVASVAQGAVLLGEPDAGRVVALPPAAGRSTIPEGPAFDRPGIQFGAAVLAVDTAAGFDLYVGAPEDRFSRGSVYVFRGAHDGGRPIEEADLRITVEAPAAKFGSRLFPCADLEGDGIADLAVSAPWYADPAIPSVPPLSGGITLLLSSMLATAEAPEGIVFAGSVGRTWWGVEEGESAGDAVSCDTDLDGDGSVDLVVGAPYAGSIGSGTEASGRLYVLSTGALLPPGDLALDEVAHTIIDGQTEEWFGSTLATMQLDDVPALVVGAPGYGGGRGRVWLLQRGELSGAALTVTVGPALLSTTPDLNEVHLGRFAAVGDVDGDNADDLLLGAPDYGIGPDRVDLGKVWTFLGANRGRWDDSGPTTDDADGEIAGTEPFQRVGQDMVVADVDGDGDHEVLLPTRAALP
jgi:hypothetical protein